MTNKPVNPPVDKEITRFIKQHHQFVLATSYDNKPWTANCFYAYIETNNMFVFTSDFGTRHGKEMLHQKEVAGNISLETRIPGKIQGLQFSGTVVLLEDVVLEQAKKAYLWKFPVAMIMETTLWGLMPCLFKLTDNRLGFGKKLIWDITRNNS